MSRIGKKAIPLPKGVEVVISGQDVQIKGPKGSLSRTVHSTMRLEKNEQSLQVVSKENLKEHGKFHGLTRSLLNNMVTGVTEGFSKNLTLIGVGYRAAVKGKELHLTLGYSHPVIYPIPEGIELKMDGQTKLSVMGTDKEQVGQSAADIRSFRKPEPYHGKGVRYSDERIITKVGKSAGKK